VANYGWWSLSHFDQFMNGILTAGHHLSTYTIHHCGVKTAKKTSKNIIHSPEDLLLRKNQRLQIDPKKDAEKVLKPGW
jgi:hypothetical protein